jgi:hypothetical protein
VHEDHYEEEHDWNLVRLLPKNLRVEKVKAYRLSQPRLVGDIGLRAFLQLYKKAKQLIRAEGFDFLYVPIPSFYCALIGRLLHHSTGIKYGIDYIDPWVHHFPGSDQLFSRPWFSTWLAKWLEPIAIKKVGLITGVAAGYYQSVLERNPHLIKQAVVGAMPYGGESKDYEVSKQLNLKPFLFKKKAGKIQMVYAGAMLPKAFGPLEGIFKSIRDNPEIFANVEFHFIGTGKTADDANGYNIKKMAEQFGLWQVNVFEYPKRIPYLDVLVHLQQSDGIFILGSTEAHYTPSKIYQGVLSGKPLLAVLHSDSTAVEVIRASRAGLVLDFKGENELSIIEKEFPANFKFFYTFLESFEPAQVDMAFFESFSAKAVTGQLVKLLNEAMAKDEAI